MSKRPLDIKRPLDQATVQPLNRTVLVWLVCKTCTKNQIAVPSQMWRIKSQSGKMAKNKKQANAKSRCDADTDYLLEVRIGRQKDQISVARLTITTKRKL